MTDDDTVTFDLSLDVKANDAGHPMATITLSGIPLEDVPAALRAAGSNENLDRLAEAVLDALTGVAYHDAGQVARRG